LIGVEQEEGDVVLEKKYNFIKTTYDISLDSQISLLPLGFSLQSRDESKGDQRKDSPAHCFYLPHGLQRLID